MKQICFKIMKLYIYNVLAAILKKSALMALSSIRIFAGTLVPIAMCIRFIKMVVSENPPGGAWGATVAHRLYGVKSNITMIARVCDPKSRRDLWLENRLVICFVINNVRSFLS